MCVWGGGGGGGLKRGGGLGGEGLRVAKNQNRASGEIQTF